MVMIVVALAAEPMVAVQAAVVSAVEKAKTALVVVATERAVAAVMVIMEVVQVVWVLKVAGVRVEALAAGQGPGCKAGACKFHSRCPGYHSCCGSCRCHIHHRPHRAHPQRQVRRSCLDTAAF